MIIAFTEVRSVGDWYDPTADGFVIERRDGHFICQREIGINPQYVISVSPAGKVDGKPTTEIRVKGNAHQVCDSYHSVVRKLNGSDEF